MAVAVLTGLALLLAGCGAHYDFVIHDNETADLSYVMWDSSGLSLISRESCTQAKLEKSTPLPKGVKANYTFTSHNGQRARSQPSRFPSTTCRPTSGRSSTRAGSTSSTCPPRR